MRKWLGIILHGTLIAAGTIGTIAGYPIIGVVAGAANAALPSPLTTPVTTEGDNLASKK